MIEFRDIFQTIATIRNNILTGFGLQHSNKLNFFFFFGYGDIGIKK